MLNPTILFSNFFRSKSITPKRLYGFGIVVLQALQLANDNKQFDAIIAALTAALTSLKKEMSGVDINLTNQKTETEMVDNFIVSFYQYMSESEPFIAKQLGGRSSAGFREFYPFGQTEYSKATKTDMPLLTLRVKEAAVKYESKLDAELAQQLQAFEGDYEALYTSQQTQINTVKNDRTERSSAFISTQLVLTQAVYTVGLQYPGDVAKCGSFFPFAMLYPHNKRESLAVRGNLEKNASANLLNRQLLKGATIAVNNTGDNASFAVWAAASPDAPMPADATAVTATSNTVTILASMLGDLEKNTFFMIKNLSDINSCSYEVTFTGFKKKKVVKAAADTTLMEVLSA